MPEAQAVPKQQQPQATQASKFKKIELYATHLVNEAVAKEKAGRYGDSIVDYLQAADLLLLLAKGTKDYTPWKTFSDRAIACHQRVRILIAKRKLAEEAAEAAPAPRAAPQPAPLAVPQAAPQPAPLVVTQTVPQAVPQTVQLALPAPQDKL